MFEVRLKPGHPTGTYRRAGMEFTSEPVSLEGVNEETLKILAADPWLIVGPADEKSGQKNQASAAASPSPEDLAELKSYMEKLEARNHDLEKLADEQASTIDGLTEKAGKLESQLAGEMGRVDQLNSRIADLEAVLSEKDREIVSLQEKKGKK